MAARERAWGDLPPERWARAALIGLTALGGATVASLALVGRMPAGSLVAVALATVTYGAVALRLAPGPLRAWLTALLFAAPCGVVAPGVIEEGARVLDFAAIARDAMSQFAGFLRDALAQGGLGALLGATALAALVGVPLRFGRVLERRLVVRAAVWLGLVVAATAVARELAPHVGHGGIAAWPSVAALAFAGLVLAVVASRDAGARARCLLAIAGLESMSAILGGAMLLLDARPLTSVVALAVPARGTTCALRADGTVLCWGRNDDGALGDDKRGASSIPVLIKSLSDAVQLDDGDACALRRDGALFCWGGNASERDKRTSTLPPARVIGGGCALLVASDDVLCWAEARDGTASTWVRVANAPGATRIVRTGYGGCARGDDGLHCWGKRDGAPDSDGMQPPCLPPWATKSGSPPPPDERITSDLFLLEVEDDGSLRTWNPFPDGEPPRCSPPTLSPRGLSLPRRVVFAASAMKRETDLAYCELGETGRVACWDLVGHRHDELESAVDLTSDRRDGRFCAALADGTAWCWNSRNGEGELGDGTNLGSEAPREVVHPH